MYGSYLHDGLGLIPGARYAGESLSVPKAAPFTRAARGGTTEAMYGPTPRIPARLFGRTPVWEAEGQQVDPFYDVRRNSGLGQVSVMYEKPGSLPSGRRDPVALAKNITPGKDSDPVPSPEPAPSFLVPALALAGIAFALYTFSGSGSVSRMLEKLKG